MNRVTEILTGGVIAPRPNTAPLAEGWNVLSGIDPGGIKPIPKITIQKLFEAQAALRPGAVALIFEGQSITYGDLNSRSNHLAARLRELGVGPEVLVGICVERSFEMLVGLLGILKAGGAYVPMDPSYPSERLEFLLRDAEPMVLLTQEKLLPSLPRHPAQVLCLDALPPGAGAENLQPLNSPDNAAYVIYTSGSTGQPKGVVVTHHNVIRLFAATDQWYGFSERDVWTLFHSFAFDFSVWEIFGALLHGGRLVVVPHPVSRSPDAFYELLAQERVTVLNQTPSAFRQLMQAEESFAGEKNLALRLVIFGGETLDLQSLKPWFERHGDTHPQLVNMYGITETTVHVTYRPLAADDVNQPSVIGLPIPDLQLHILDQQLNPVAIGEAGEIFVGGAGLARSYLKRPELTEQRFVGNPFSKEAGARLYRSGDIARRLPNNDIEYLGRADLQVKIRGHRVELGEIEAVLNQHPAIRESVVLLRQESGLPRLVGYLISCRNELATTSDVKKFLLTKLPDYMVPASFVWLHRMPLTVNGKLDRNALPAPTQQRPELDQAYVAPATELEQFLAGIWRELLGLDQVGVHDKFFELGGDSIQGAEFIAQVEKKLGEQIYVVVLFKAPTVAGFSAYLEKNYPSAMARIFPSSAENAHAKSAEDETPRKIDAGILAQARRVIPSLAPRTYPGTGKNPPAMFILAPPRSGTSLLRVMLAGNPQIFATSELHLLGFNTLAERKAAFTGNYSLWLEGLVRTVMEIKKCNAEEATRIMEGYESGDLPTKQFYGLLQEWIGQRLLVEKTPGYALNMEILHRAEADFSNPLYIHLVRNPLAMVRSFEKNHLDQVYFTYQHSFSSRQLGELFWLIANQNISEFLKNIPLHRQFYMRFEELVTQPREIMEQMCRRFGLEFHEDMVQPYKDPEKKMLDGVHAQSRSMTDANFFKYKGIEAGTAQALMAAEEDFLGELTWELAKQFGYNRNIGATSSREFLIGERRRLRQACRQNLTIHRNSNE